jgi:AraC-like DNA-binding protein
MDQLSNLLKDLSLRAGVFYTGELCGVHSFPEDRLRGHFHLIRRGSVRVLGVQNTEFEIRQPTILFLPRPEEHRLISDHSPGADVVCGTVQFGGGGSNPISDSLPSVVLVELASLKGVEALLDLMFDEAFSEQCGRQAALDRLCEVLLIRLLRHCIDNGLTKGGTLAGLADKRLAKALTAIHREPARRWELEDMAAQAGMSRARFAIHFRDVTGETPADYVASWRIMLAQRMLKRGRPLKHVACEVGYGSPSALTRAFVRKLGISPSDWLKEEAAWLPHHETTGHQNETPGSPETVPAI